MNQAIGMIETQGLLALIEATDAMLKSSDVQCLGKKQVGGGLNAVLVTGDVAAIQTAVQAGIASVQRLGAELLTASHVIPRPNIDALEFIESGKKTEPVVELPSVEPEETRVEALVEIETNDVSEVIEVAEIQAAEEMLAESEEDLLEVIELEETLEALVPEESSETEEIEPKERLLRELQQMKVTELRKLAKEQVNFSIPQKNIYSTKKEKLINALLDSLIINE